MQNMPDFSDVMRLAQTPEGKKLISMLQNSDSTALNTALSSAQAGDYSSAKNALSAFLNTPEAQALLQALGR